MSHTPHFCQHCRAPLQPGLRFCEQCGQPVIASPPVRSRSNRGLLLGGVGVLLAVLCLMALVVAGLLLLFPIRREQAGPVSAPVAATVGDTPVAATVIPPTPAIVEIPSVTSTSVTTPTVAAAVSNFVRIVEVKSPEQVTAGEMFGITITYAWSFNPEGTVGIRAEGGGATRDAPGRPTLVSGAGEASAELGKFAPDQPGQHTFFVETYGLLPDGSEIIDRRQVTVNVIAAPDTTATGGSADYVRITDVQMPPQIPTGVIFGVTVNYEWSFADQSELRLRGSFGNAADSFITKNVQGSGQDSIYLGKHALSELGPHTLM
jgi:hypothetical protein